MAMRELEYLWSPPTSRLHSLLRGAKLDLLEYTTSPPSPFFPMSCSLHFHLPQAGPTLQQKSNYIPNWKAISHLRLKRLLLYFFYNKQSPKAQLQSCIYQLLMISRNSFPIQALNIQLSLLHPLWLLINLAIEVLQTQNQKSLQSNYHQ